MKAKKIINVTFVKNPSLHQDISRNTSRQFMMANEIINVSNLKKLYCGKKNPLKNKEISFLRNTIRENIGATIYTLKESKHIQFWSNVICCTSLVIHVRALTNTSRHVYDRIKTCQNMSSHLFFAEMLNAVKFLLFVILSVF